MKKISLLLMSAVMCLSLSSCSSDKSETNESSTAASILNSETAGKRDKSRKKAKEDLFEGTVAAAEESEKPAAETPTPAPTPTPTLAPTTSPAAVPTAEPIAFGNGQELNPGNFREFDEFTTYGVPDDVNYLSLKYAEGPWKYEMFFAETSFYYDELGYAELSLNRDANTVRVVLHPRKARDEGDYYYVSDEDIGYEPFEGGRDDSGSLTLSGNNSMLYVTKYFAWEGREYMIAKMYISEEEYGEVWMYRGQD